MDGFGTQILPAIGSYLGGGGTPGALTFSLTYLVRCCGGGGISSRRSTIRCVGDGDVRTVLTGATL